MKTITAYGYAKLNLYLDIVAVKDGYHMLESVVTTVNLRDEVTVTSRRDNEIILKEARGLFASTLPNDNNVYKAAELFMQTFGTCGADITLKKRIPIGSGMGGSSADIAATLKAFAEVYGVNADLKPLADKLGSDSGYLLSGGFAKLTGRGENVEKLEVNKKLYAVVITSDGGVNTADCFKLYDEMNEAQSAKNGANRLIDALISGNYTNDMFYNALYLPACEINPKVKTAYEDLANLSPRAVCMTGSGSSVFALFDTVELALWAQSRLKRKHKDVFVVDTLTEGEVKQYSRSRSLYSL